MSQHIYRYTECKFLLSHVCHNTIIVKQSILSTHTELVKSKYTLHACMAHDRTVTRSAAIVPGFCIPVTGHAIFIRGNEQRLSKLSMFSKQVVVIWVLKFPNALSTMRVLRLDSACNRRHGFLPAATDALHQMHSSHRRWSSHQKEELGLHAAWRCHMAGWLTTASGQSRRGTVQWHKI